MNRSSLHHTMRGGQIVFHYIRMGLQVIKKHILLIAIFVVVGGFSIALMTTDQADYDNGIKYAMAKIYVEQLGWSESKTQYLTPKGRQVTVKWGTIHNSKSMEQHYENLKNAFVFGVKIAFYSGFFIMVLWFAYLRYRGVTESSDEFKRGVVIGNIAQHEKLIKAHEKDCGHKSVLELAGIKLPPTARNTGMAFVGSPGSGKTASMVHLLKQLRGLGDKFYVIDPNGDYTRKFYREGVDIILSPADSRSAYWDVWSDGRTAQNYHITATSLIVDEPAGNSGNDFFSKAARFVFEALCAKLDADEKRKGDKVNLKKLANYILRVDDETLIDMVKHTDARSVLNEGSEKTAASIRATLSVYLQPLAMLPENGTRFSFREWVNSDNDSCVFIPVSPLDREYFKPILSSWFEHLTVSILSRNEDVRHRVIHASCDELPALNKIPSLKILAAEQRKFGGNLIIGYQSPAQLKEVYGELGAAALEDLMNSYFLFRINGNTGSEWASKLLMGQEVLKASESLSMGAADVRDSVSIQRAERMNQNVLPSEVVSLKNFEFFARFGQGYNIVKGKQTWPVMTDIAPALLPRDVVMTITEPEKDNEEGEVIEGESTPVSEEKPKKKSTGKDYKFNLKVMPPSANPTGETGHLSQDIPDYNMGETGHLFDEAPAYRDDEMGYFSGDVQLTNEKKPKVKKAKPKKDGTIEPSTIQPEKPNDDPVKPKASIKRIY